jgi:predicted Fe-Mo cluster-binding NifX family protein
MIVETDSGSCRAIQNRNDHQSHGACMPLESFRGEQFDGLVVGGIGMGALVKLLAAGFTIFQSNQATVEEIVNAAKAGTLQKMAPGMTCAGHGGGCGHDHS